MWRNRSSFAEGRRRRTTSARARLLNYNGASSPSRSSTKDGVSIFAGQRDDAFFGDIGAIFDLRRLPQGRHDGQRGRRQGLLRRLQRARHRAADPDLRADRRTNSTIGIWASTERRNVTVDGKLHRGWTQVSRLGNPLVNEVVVPTPVQGRVEPCRSPGRQAVRRPGRHADPREADERPLQAERTRDEPGRPGGRASAPASRASTSPATRSRTCCG